MKLVVISSLGAVHLHVVAQIARRHPPIEILRPYRPKAPAPPIDERLARALRSPVDAARDGARDRLRDARIERTEREIAALLFPAVTPEVSATSVPVKELCSPHVVARLRALSPDVIFVSGAPVLRPEVFTIPRFGTINLHYGVAPEYRGEDTLFWAMVRGDHERLGVTLHTIDRGVDTGQLLAHGFPRRRGGESESELWASCADLGARLATVVLDTLGGRPLSGVPQPPGGRQYFRRERTPLRDLQHQALRAIGRTPPAAPERIYYYRTPGERPVPAAGRRARTDCHESGGAPR
ncbi:MAG: formyl transferase [Polyangiaceae bacterium]